jgi:hypothetical protein
VDGTSPAIRPYEVIVWMRSAPRAVMLDSKPLPLLSDANGHKPEIGWRFDTLTHQLHAVFLAEQFHLEVSGGTL